jgi:hypothetical protein
MTMPTSKVRKYDAPETGDANPFYSLDQLDEMDRRFVEAMLAARRHGRERCTVGVVTAPGTRRPTRISGARS